MMRWMYIRNTYRGYIARLNNENGGLLIPKEPSLINIKVVRWLLMRSAWVHDRSIFLLRGLNRWSPSRSYFV